MSEPWIDAEMVEEGGVGPGSDANLKPQGQTLDQREEFYRSVLDSLSEGVIITDEDSRVLFANRVMECLTGWKPAELLGRISYEVLSPPEIWPAMRQRLRERLSGKQEVYENELICKDGSRHWILVRASPYRSSNGRILGTIGAMSCIQKQKELEHENDQLRGFIAAEHEFTEILGKSSALGKVIEQIRMVAPTEASVLILGESGSGKELVARAIHGASQRKAKPLVRVNCASVPKELFESEFFGHVKGAFTGAVRDRAGRFEFADGGTLFLDEVGEIPSDLQAKLLRVLQEGTFERVGEERTRRANVRIVAATNRDLQAEAKAGRFRLDLYYRLSVFPIELPPLRDRKDDIRPLAEHFAAEIGRRLARTKVRIPANQWPLLEGHDWPGNVRELQNLVERAVILARDGVLDFSGLLPAGTPRAGGTKPDRSGAEASAMLPTTIESLRREERRLLLEALEAAGGKIYGRDGAAARLGLKPTTLSSRLKRWGLR
ncbi:MAG: sigma 54-interacting transcriptional regulator [Verrucomicrobiales bacterium]|nr:sigma 54-interacting transcriptional regulator [Verrucomicrobiales bacterium]